MAVRLNKTFLVLSLPIISIVSLYLYCRRQSKQSSDSDQPQADTIQPVPKEDEQSKCNSIRFDNEQSTKPEMQLVSSDNPSIDNKSINGEQAKKRRSNQASKTKRSTATPVQHVEEKLKELDLKENDNPKSSTDGSKKLLTFAQVLEKKVDVSANNGSEVKPASITSNGSINSQEIKKSDSNATCKPEKPKTDKVIENGNRKHSNQNNNNKPKLNEKNRNVINDQAKAKSVESSTKIESSSKSTNKTESSSIKCEKVQNKPLIGTLPQNTVNSCPTVNTGDSSNAFKNESEVKQLSDSHPQQSQFSDVYSENSSDSGKGSSEINRNETPSNPALIATPPMQQIVTAEFEFPNELIAMLIGRYHASIDAFRSQSGAEITINPSSFTFNCSILSIVGRQEQIDHALSLIHARFPIAKFPYFDPQNQLVYSPNTNPILPVNFKVTLPTGICDVILTAMTNAGTLFLIQPHHPMYASFRTLFVQLNQVYSTSETPLLQSFQHGIICVANVQNEWHRAMIFDWIDENNYWVRLVDSGKLVQVNASSLRQILSNFLAIPFQACECLLSGIQPVDPEAGWSEEANAFVYQLLNGHVLKANVVGHTERDIPLVNLFKASGQTNTLINAQLVNNGFGKYIKFS